MKVPTFVNQTCIGSHWNSTQYDGLYFGTLTPCFNDVIVVGVVHLAFFGFLIARCRQLCSRNYEHHKLQGAAVYYIRVGLSLIATLAPTFSLVSKTAAWTAKKSDILDLYGPNGENIMPFELIYYGIVITSYLFFTVVAVLEIRSTVLRGQWMLRFCALFGFLSLTVRMIYIIELEPRLGHPMISFLTVDFMVLYAAVGLLTLIGIFHHPSSDRFTLLEYRLVPVFVSESIANKKDPKVCPESKAGIFSTLTFGWLTPMIKYGYKTPLEDSDIWYLSKNDRTKTVFAKLDKNWQEERKKDKPSMFRALRKTFIFKFFLAWLFKFGNDAAQFLGPIMLQYLIENATSSHPSITTGVALSCGMFAGQVLGAVCECQYFQIVMRAGMHVRSAMVLKIFKKAISLNPTGRSEHSSGKLSNMISSDCENLQQVCGGLLTLWSSPIRIIVAVYLLEQLLGPAAFVAVGVIVICVPIQKQLVKMTVKYLKKSLKSTDERVRLGTEVMGAMEIVKCYAWENSLNERVMTTREKELYWIRKRQILSSINSFMISAVPVMVTVFTFLVFTATGRELTPSIAFTALSLFSVLRMPLMQLPQTINNIISASVALNRLQDFLLADDLPQEPPLTSAKEGEDAITVAPSDFKWTVDAAAPTALSDIEVRIAQGELMAVIGGTGMGKSSLVSALLGEMIVTKAPVAGNPVRMRGSVAYVGQQAWIFNATVRENILFGRPYDSRKYQHAIWLSSLNRDLEIMDAGDRTEIGEKGVNLSGGQKQRLSIARAVYADPDIVLMDDPLSALDAHVAKEIYERCILGHFRKKTVVFVTNRLEFVSKCDRITVMRDGHIASCGTYSELEATCEEFQELMSDQSQTDDEASGGTGDNTSAEFVFDPDFDDEPKPELASVSVTRKGASINDDDKESKQVDKPKGTLIQAEKREKGQIGGALIKVYANAMGGLAVLLFLMFTFFTTEGLRLFASIWVKDWSNAMHHKSGGAHAHGSYYYIGIYAAISGGQSLSQFTASLYSAVTGVRAGRNLHMDMFRSLLKAPMSFFNSTPLGRIVNRLSKDTADVDRNLVPTTTFFIRGLLQVLGTFVIIGITTPYTLAAFAPVLAIFWWTYRFFQSTNRELKRLDSVARSPIYSFFSQCLAGLPTIRAYGSQIQVSDQIANKIDSQTRMTLALFSSNRWLSLRLELLGGIMIFICAMFLVIGTQSGAVDPGTMGLALSYALQITSLLNMTVRLAAVAENSFNSVERVHEYALVKPERVEAPKDEKPPPSDWPARGRIEFSNVSMRYRDDLPLVLKNLDFDVAPAQKIGIVGRTGAGKSTTFLTLFRIVEAASGKIEIDGLDISKLSMFALRSKLSIIPQEPVLFTGSIRFNLDPFSDYDEQLLWDALERAHLKTLVQSMPQGIDTEVVEGGENFSVGQRQLLCLARALIRRSSILVLDEATAAVDVGTDALIQKTIREEFAECTVLAIAHRLNTIIDSDQILVLDAGEKVEFGSPADLLSNPNGVFTAMVNDTGESNAKMLRSIALGELKLEETLEEASNAAKAAAGVRMSSLAELGSVQFKGPLLEKVRSSLLSIKSAVYGINTQAWQNALTDNQYSQQSWLADLRAIFEELIAVATEKIGDKFDYEHYKFEELKQLETQLN